MPTGLLRIVQDRQRAPAYGNQASRSNLLVPWEHDTEGSGREGFSHLGHRIKMASTSLGGFLLCCTRCGSYAWKRARAIAAQCPGPEVRPGLAAQKRKLAAGLFPGIQTGTIGVLMVPTSSMVQWLLCRMQGHEQSGEGFFDP